MVATAEFGDLHGHCWGMSHGKGRSLPFTRNAHTNPYAYISTLLFSKPLPGPRPFSTLLPTHTSRRHRTEALTCRSPHQSWKDGGTKAWGLGRDGPSPPKMRRAAPLPLPLPQLLASPVAPGITRGPLGLGHGGFHEGPFDEDHNRDKAMPKASAQRKAGAQPRGWKG